MKQLVYIIIGLLSVACSSKSQKVDITQPANNTIHLEVDDIELINNTLSSFINTDEQTICKGEKSYLAVAEIMQEDLDTIGYKTWYRNNVAHIDSIATNAIELLDAKEYDLLLTLMESELPNFQSYPIANTYMCFDLNIIIGKLSRLKIRDKKEWFAKLVPLWELNRVQIEAVQSGWDRPHPLYEIVINDLLNMYDELDNQEKKSEIQNIINQQKTYSE